MKPTVFNYTEHEKALAEIERLKSELEQCNRDKTNLLIQVRILEDENKRLKGEETRR